MQNIIEPSTESLLLELKKRALRELVTNEAAYEELVDDLIDEKLEWGELKDNENNVALRERLIARWPDILRYIQRQSKEIP